jgi:predicted alpha/beta-fold hydrolase
MPDGGQIAMDWAYPPEAKEDLTKVCFVFPGLSGSSDRHYIKSLVRHLTEDRGYIVGVFHNRGVTLEYTSPELADLSSSAEIETAIAHMQDKFKGHPNPVYVGVGMSMGANLMLRVAGEQGARCPFDAMVSFNNPFDIMLSINLMRNTPYEKYLARELRKNVLIRDNASEREREIFKQMETKFNISFEDLKNTESWGEFDNKFTLRVRSQFKTVADYYHAASCLFRIKEIEKPTLVIHSRDDPIIPIDCLPIRECSSNPNIIVGVVNCGGHVCYFQGSDG